MVNNYQLHTTSYLPAPKGCLRYANRLSSPACQPIMTSFMQNKPNFRNAKMKLNLFATKGYENISPIRKCENKPNQTQFLYQLCKNKPNRTQFLYQLCKTNPIKPNFIRHSLREGGFKRGNYAALRPPPQNALWERFEENPLPSEFTLSLPKGQPNTADKAIAVRHKPSTANVSVRGLRRTHYCFISNALSLGRAWWTRSVSFWRCWPPCPPHSHIKISWIFSAESCCRSVKKKCSGRLFSSGLDSNWQSAAAAPIAIFIGSIP